MPFNVNDLAAGYDNVTSLFGLSARDQTILLFRRLLTEAEHESLLTSGKTRCFPIYIVPAYLQYGGKLQDITVAIPTRHPISTYRCQYYLFDCGSREINARPETRDKKYSPNMRSSHVSTRSRRWVTVNRKRGIDTWQTSTTISSNNLVIVFETKPRRHPDFPVDAKNPALCSKCHKIPMRSGAIS
jgi:hypothetical protein